jgi:outer membrane receptor protein involved in Fe transport
MTIKMIPIKSKKLIYLIFIIICFNIIGYATCLSSDIIGKIRDAETHKPLANANIVILNTELGSFSDSNGSFKIFMPYKGEFELLVTMIGYKHAKKKIVIDRNDTQKITFDLKPTVLQLSSVSVTGKRDRDVVSEPRRESPALEIVTSTISQREIKRQGAKTIVDAVKYIPGAMIETRGRKVKQFVSFRGQRYPYPDYAVNGAWQREFHETPYFFATNDIDRIEVIRSSAALLTGLSGLAGVINIVTKNYEQPQTSREIEYGSFGTFRTHISHGGKFGNMSYASGIGFRHTDGPPKKHAAERLANFYGSLGWIPNNKLTMRLDLFHLDGKRELALADEPAAIRFRTELVSFSPFRTTLTNLKIRYQPSDEVATDILLYYTHRDPTLIDEDENTHEITKTSERDFESGANIIQSVTLSENNVLRFGGLYNRWIAPNGKRFYVGKRCDLSTYSAVVANEHRFNRLSLDAGLRWQKTYIENYGAFNINGSSKLFKKVTSVKDEWEPSLFQGSVGLVYYFPMNYSLFLNTSAGEILPRRGSLDLNLQKPENEQRIKIDVGLKKMWYGIGQISVTGFLVNQKSAIVLSGQLHDSETRTMELYLNRNQDQFGLEFETKVTSMFDFADAFLNVAVMSSRMEVDGEKQRNKELPQIITNCGIYANYNSYDFTILGQYISSFESTRFVASTQDNPAQAQPLGDFVAINVTFGKTIIKSINTRIYLEIQNLTDQNFSTVVGYPDFGRRFTLGVMQRF